MFTKKELIRLQSKYFTEYRSIISELKNQNMPKLPPKKDNQSPAEDFARQSSMLSEKSKVILSNNLSLKTCIENVMVHNTLSIEDQYEEILCIEQNL